MKALDLRLAVIAKIAGVRPPHVHHTYHALKEAGDGFDPESFAAFCQLELRHVVAIVDALTLKGWLPLAGGSRSASTPSKGSSTRTLVAPTDIPANWISYAQEKRRWSILEATDEAEGFLTWAKANGRTYNDWDAAWQGWARRSHRADGNHDLGAKPASVGDQIAWHEKQQAFYNRLGRDGEAEDHKRAANKLRTQNVVPFRLQG